MQNIDIGSIKLIAGTLIIVSLVIGFLEKWYAPHMIVLESSPDFPNWLGWAGWIIAASAALTYIGLDVFEHLKQ